MAKRFVTFKRTTDSNGSPIIQFLDITTFKPVFNDKLSFNEEFSIKGNNTPLIKDEREVIEVDLERPPIENVNLTDYGKYCIDIISVQNEFPLIQSVEQLFVEAAWPRMSKDFENVGHDNYTYCVLDGTACSPKLKYLGNNYNKVENIVRSALAPYKVKNKDDEYVLHIFGSSVSYKDWDKLINDVLDNLVIEHQFRLDFDNWDANNKGFIQVFRRKVEEEF